MATELEELIGFLSHPSPPVLLLPLSLSNDYSLFCFISCTYGTPGNRLKIAIDFPFFFSVRFSCSFVVCVFEMWYLLLFFAMQIKKAAVNILRDYTGSEDGLQSLEKYFDAAVPPLCRLLSEKKVLLLLNFGADELWSLTCLFKCLCVFWRFVKIFVIISLIERIRREFS